jgi:hypothetical protein
MLTAAVLLLAGDGQRLTHIPGVAEADFHYADPCK